MVAHDSHHLVSLHIVHVQYVQVIETVVEGLTDLVFEVNCAIENS
jgi:hypothetical protein